jgi:hypothetical protein
MDNKIKYLSDLIATKSAMEAECFPIDRYFLDPYMNDILDLNRTDFLLYNFERGNTNYTVQLMLCLPELWEEIEMNDIINLIEKFSNVFSFYALINFTYRYIEIDIFKIIFQSKLMSDNFILEIKEYLKSQYPNLLKTESDYLFFEEGIWGIKNENWIYIKQKLLLDKRVFPALQSLKELQRYITTLVR